ncbi:MAG TPA: hypothetical protein VGK65_22465, partial [Candidatus Binatia bacterium]
MKHRITRTRRRNPILTPSTLLRTGFPRQGERNHTFGSQIRKFIPIIAIAMLLISSNSKANPYAPKPGEP